MKSKKNLLDMQLYYFFLSESKYGNIPETLDIVAQYNY